MSLRSPSSMRLAILHLALAGEQGDRAHLAQVHAHGVVGPGLFVVAVVGEALLGITLRVATRLLPAALAASSLETTCTPSSTSIFSQLPISDGLMRSGGSRRPQVIVGDETLLLTEGDELLLGASLRRRCVERLLRHGVLET